MVSELQLARLQKLASFDSSVTGGVVVVEVDLSQGEAYGLRFL